MNTITMTLQVDHLILEALKEDISSEDVSTNAVMKEYVKGEVELICKQDGIIAGLDVYRRVFELLDDKTETEFYCKDGDEVKNGQLMGKVTGDIRVLLSGERVALNYLQRMSGIATYTHSVAALLEGSKTKLLDTRKTTPNMRIFEKYAVRVGGGYNHRYNLSDGVLLKDNHIGAAGSVTAAVKMAKEYGVSVLFSSHMLDEVGRISDRVIYIKDGELLGERTREEMFAGERYLLAVDNAERAVQLLAALPSVLSCKSAGENRLRVESQKNTVGELAAALLAGGIVLSDIQKESDQLENIYREIFKEGEK